MSIPCGISAQTTEKNDIIEENYADNEKEHIEWTPEVTYGDGYIVIKAPKKIGEYEPDFETDGRGVWVGYTIDAVDLDTGKRIHLGSGFCPSYYLYDKETSKRTGELTDGIFDYVLELAERYISAPHYNVSIPEQMQNIKLGITPSNIIGYKEEGFVNLSDIYDFDEYEINFAETGFIWKGGNQKSSIPKPEITFTNDGGMIHFTFKNSDDKSIIGCYCVDPGWSLIYRSYDGTLQESFIINMPVTMFDGHDSISLYAIDKDGNYSEPTVITKEELSRITGNNNFEDFDAKDITGDGIITKDDMDKLARYIMNHRAYKAEYDFNNDGKLDGLDLAIMKVHMQQD